MFPGDESGGEVEACSVSNILPHDKGWYFPRKEIEQNSPSRLDGIDLRKETFLRKSYCSFLKDLGDRLDVSQITIATAIVFCHRFFILQSHKNNDRWTIATACMLLAVKAAEDTQRELKDIVIFSHKITHKKDLDADIREEVYEQQKKLVLTGQFHVLSTLKFELNVSHPYKPLTDAIEKCKFKEAKAQFSKVAESFVNDCLRTSLCLQYKPHHIAAYAFFHAAKHLGKDLEAHREILYKEFDITFSELEDLHDQMLELDNWYFSREEIENNSPSRLDGIDLKKETSLRKSYCYFLKDLGVKLKVSHATIATAIVLCHRFFIRQSHAKNDSLTIATVCMLLAAKVENNQRDIKDVIKFSYEIIHKEKLDVDQRKEEYEKQKELVLNGEELVLSTLNFDLTVEHPYKALAHAILRYEFKKVNAEFPKVALIYVNTCLQTTLPLQYKSHHIAGYGFFAAAANLKISLKAYGDDLFQEFDITRSQFADIHNQMNELSKSNSEESVTQNPDNHPVQDTSKAEGI